MTNNQLCNEPAVIKVLWPTGEKLPMCDRHYQWAVKVAHALSTTLRVDDLDEENQTCTQHLSSKERETISP